MSINKIILIGRLTRDPELRRTTSDVAISTFTIAVDNRGKDNGTSFIPCVAFNGVAESIARCLRKGALIGVEGALNQRTYVNKDNEKVSVIEVLCDNVQFLESKGSSAEQTEETSVEQDIQEIERQKESYSREEAEKVALEDLDDDLPF